MYDTICHPNFSFQIPLSLCSNTFSWKDQSSTSESPEEVFPNTDVLEPLTVSTRAPAGCWSASIGHVPHQPCAPLAGTVNGSFWCFSRSHPSFSSPSSHYCGTAFTDRRFLGSTAFLSVIDDLHWGVVCQLSSSGSLPLMPSNVFPIALTKSNSSVYYTIRLPWEDGYWKSFHD